MLSQWPNKGLNLFTVQKEMFQINIGQPSYNLPASTIMATEVYASNNQRLLGGTPFSSAGGTASNAFDGNSATACTQNAINGYISYTYPSGYTPSVYYVGVQSNDNITYDLVFEYSFDGAYWINGLTIGSQFYPIGQIVWSVVEAPINAQYIRIREIGGATLNIQELYFSSPLSSRILTAISREEWSSYPNKQQQATVSSFYFDRQIQPIMTLWYTPDNTYETVVYNCSRQIMDVSQMNENIEIPVRFMEAGMADLAARMAEKFALERYDRLKMRSDEAYQIAGSADTENVVLRIQPDMTSYH